MTKTSSIAEAQRLLDAGKRDEAKELLLTQGYVKQLDEEVMAAYLRLFPAQGVMREKIDGVIAQLKSADTTARADAAKSISKDARREMNMTLTEWLADPRTTGPLIELLDDPEPTVVEAAAQALGDIIFRYFQDLRAFDPLARLVGSPKKTIRQAAVFGVGALPHKERWQMLLPALSDKSVDVRRTACYAFSVGSGEGKIPASMQKQAIPILRGLLADTNADLRGVAKSALSHMGG